MDWYRVSLLRIGHAVVQAESEKDAKRKVGMLSEKEIHWMEEQNETSGLYLVTNVELADCVKMPPCREN